MGVKVSGMPLLHSYLEQRSERLVAAFIQGLNEIGIECVNYVRDRDSESSWEDQTGNLRSSIGYMIFHDGVAIAGGGFEKVEGPKAGTTEEDGSIEGQTYAESLGSKFPTGYALVVVAGMKYAAFVEARDNKDVLASCELYMKKQVKQLVREFEEDFGL